MSRETSPYTRGDVWLDKRRDGKAQDIWQIAVPVKRSVVYRSTYSERIDDAIVALDAYVEKQKALGKQEPGEAQVLPMLIAYWDERGKKLVNKDQTGRSLRTFIAFMAQDTIGARAVVTDLTPSAFERFREWRMAPHAFSIPWGGEIADYSSEGVSGPTVQRNINDVRAAVHHARDNMRIPMAPRIKDLGEEYKSAPRERVLTFDEMVRIAWYASHNKALFRFVALQFSTAVRPQAALKFNPRTQFVAGKRIDLQPTASKRTKKRNAIIPAIRPMRAVLRQWAKDEPEVVESRKTAWRIMRRTLNLTSDVHAKTIRHTIATLLYADPTVPEREIVELLGHEGKLARTTRLYAKYDPDRLVNVVRVLTTLWRQVKKAAREYGAVHMLTTEGQGGKNVVVVKSAKC